MYQSYLKFAVCNLFSYDGLTVRNVENWEAWHRLSSGQLRYQADRNTGGRIFEKFQSEDQTLQLNWNLSKFRNSPTDTINRKYSHVRSNLFRKFCWSRSKVIQLHNNFLTYNSIYGIILTNCSETNVCGNNVVCCTVLYCNVLYCTVLYCTVLYCTVLYCTYRSADGCSIWNKIQTSCYLQYPVAVILCIKIVAKQMLHL